MRAPGKLIEPLYFRGLLALSFCVAAAGCGGEPPPLPEGGLQLRFEAIEHNLDFPYVSDMEFARSPKDELFVTDVTGGFAHLRLENGRMKVLSAAQETVYADFDAGLLGVAIDPHFEDNRFVYLALNITKTMFAIRRYTIDDDDPAKTLASMVTIWEFDTPGAPRWHNITSLGFEEEDEDVMWVTVGDKGVFDPAQDPADLRGSLLRIVPSREEGVGGYTIPKGAKLFSEGADPAVYAKGFRSPWRAILHDGKWYIGDVGLDTIEEVNIVDGPNENMGWPIVEGPCEMDVLMTAPPDCSELFVDPWIYYGRSNSHRFVAEDDDAVPTNRRSVYAGWIYKPNDKDPYKGRWNDVLVFGDTFVGFVRAKPIKGDELDYHVAHLHYPSGWAQGPDGYVYVAALGATQEKNMEVPESSPIYRAVLDE